MLLSIKMIVNLRKFPNSGVVHMWWKKEFHGHVFAVAVGSASGSGMTGHGHGRESSLPSGPAGGAGGHKISGNQECVGRFRGLVSSVSASSPTFRKLPYRMNVSSVAQVYGTRSNDGDENVVETHFANPVKKYFNGANEDGSAEKNLEELAREQNKKMQAIMKARAARELNEGQSAKRTLSWDTIDQIRYLRQENPGEWSVALLAESFNVSQEVIVKVLKSKFMPSRSVRQKQDQTAAQSSAYVTGGGAQAQALVECDQQAKQTKTTHGKHISAHKYNNSKFENASAHVNVPPASTCSTNPRTSQHERKIADSAVDTTSSYKKSQRTKDGRDDEKVVDMEFSFGKFDFENVDSLMGQVKLKPQVFRKGRNFYNENGEFLYRI